MNLAYPSYLYIGGSYLYIGDSYLYIGGSYLYIGGSYLLNKRAAHTNVIMTHLAPHTLEPRPSDTPPDTPGKQPFALVRNLATLHLVPNTHTYVCAQL